MGGGGGGGRERGGRGWGGEGWWWEKKIAIQYPPRLSPVEQNFSMQNFKIDLTFGELPGLTFYISSSKS